MKNVVAKQTYSAADVSSYLGISLVGAYNLMQGEKFPAFRIGKRILVTKEAFERWLSAKQQMNG